jgi:hypothetical protein
MSERTTRKEAPAATARLLESGVELLRAEVAVVLRRSKELSVHVLTALLATILAAAFAQVALILALLYPALSRNLSNAHLLLGLALPGGLTVASLIVAVMAWSDVRHIKRAESTPVQTAPGVCVDGPATAPGHHPTAHTSLTERLTP